jgi:plastocyanin
MEEHAMHRWRTPLAGATLAILALALAACASATPTPADGGGGGGGNTVTLSGSQFSEDTLTVAAGTAVTFTNEDSVAHTVTNGTDGAPADGAAFDEDLAGGASVDITFDEAGTFPVTCKIHPSMNMTVTVE